jgi:hypothetical protein
LAPTFTAAVALLEFTRTSFSLASVGLPDALSEVPVASVKSMLAVKVPAVIPDGQ